MEKLTIIKVAFESCDESGKILSEGKKMIEVEVSVVHYIDCPRLQGQVVENIYIADLSVHSADKRRYRGV